MEVPVSQQRLMAQGGGPVLGDGASLASLGVGEGATLHLVVDQNAPAQQAEDGAGSRGGGGAGAPPTKCSNASGREKEYKLAREKMSWYRHEAQARAWGGHISSLANAAERDLVLSMWREAGLNTQGQLWDMALWVGGIRSSACGLSLGSPVRWSDGTPFAYAPWRPGEPNNFCCAEDATGLWPDGSMNDLTGGVCPTCPMCCAALPAVYAKDAKPAAAVGAAVMER